MRNPPAWLAWFHCTLLAAGGCFELAPSDSIDFEETEEHVDTHDAATALVMIQPSESEYTAPAFSNIPAQTAPVMTEPSVFASPSLEPSWEPEQLYSLVSEWQEIPEGREPGVYIEEFLSLYADLLAFGMILPPLGVGVEEDEIRAFALGHRSDVIFCPEILGHATRAGIENLIG